MSSKKATNLKKNPAISKAPPPPPSIGSGDAGIRSMRPDWSNWNRLPSLSINECIMLLINVEPGTYLDNSKEQRYKRVSRLVQSYQSIGQFPSDYVDINPHEFIRWAESVGEEIPKGWQPIGAGPATEQQAARDVDHSETVEPIEEQEHDQNPKNDEDISGIEFKIADDLYSRMSDGSSISDNPGGTIIFDYLTNAGTLELDDGTSYFLHNENLHEGQRKGIGNREYNGVTISHNTDGKLQSFSFRKLVDAFALRKRQEIPQ